MNETDEETFGVRGDFITLGQLLKALGEARTGGEGKQMLLDGGLRVNGDEEIRRGRKLRVGDLLVLPDGRRIRMVEPSEEDLMERPKGKVVPEPEPEPPKRRFRSKIAAKRAHKADAQRRREAAGDSHQDQGKQPGQGGGEVRTDGRRGLPQGFSRRGRNRPR